MVDVYAKLKGNASTQYNKVIGGNTYPVRVGMVSPHDLHLQPVDESKETGNPRFFTIHKSILSKDPDHGPMTEQEQVDYFTEDKLDGPLADLSDTPLHKKTRERFKVMKEGLKLSGESQDDI